MTVTAQRPPFRGWLRRHRDDESPLGDLATDIHADSCWPRGPGSLDRYTAHLEGHSAGDGALDALREAWAAYVAETTP